MKVKAHMTSEQKQAKLEVLQEAITRLCSFCKDEAKSGNRTLQGSRGRFLHRIAGHETVECKAGPLHLMIIEISEQETIG